MKLNKRFLILLLLLFILILGFNSVGAADLSESGDDGTADLSLDDDLIMETTDSLPASNMDALDEGQDSIQVLNNDAFNNWSCSEFKNYFKETNSNYYENN